MRLPSVSQSVAPKPLRIPRLPFPKTPEEDRTNSRETGRACGRWEGEGGGGRREKNQRWDFYVSLSPLHPASIRNGSFWSSSSSTISGWNSFLVTLGCCYCCSKKRVVHRSNPPPSPASLPDKSYLLCLYPPTLSLSPKAAFFFCAKNL